MTRNDSIITKEIRARLIVVAKSIQMNCVEDSLQDTLYRVQVIEQKLRTKFLTIENRERLETELEEVKEVLKKNEEQLKTLRKENSKSFVIALCVCFLCFLFYGVYLMIYENV